MKNNKIIIYAVIMIIMTIAKPLAAQNSTLDIHDWPSNPSFGQNGQNMTPDGYSLWDGMSRQDYVINENGDIEIRNAAQLANYAHDMFVAHTNVWIDRRKRDVHLLCDIDLGAHYFTIVRRDREMRVSTFYGHGHTIRNGYAVPESDFWGGSLMGLFEEVGGCTIRDLTVQNYRVWGCNCTCAGIVCGYAWTAKKPVWIPEEVREGYEKVGCKFENVRVIDCDLNGDATFAGGILGYAGNGSYSEEELLINIDFYTQNAITVPDDKRVRIDECLVLNSTISTTDDKSGGIIGAAELAYLDGNRVINCNIYAEDEYAGGIMGRNRSSLGQVNAFNNLVLNSHVSGQDRVGGAFGFMGDNTGRINIGNNLIHAFIENPSPNPHNNEMAAFCPGMFAAYFFAASNNIYNTSFSNLPSTYSTSSTASNAATGKSSDQLRSFNFQGTKFKRMTNLWPQLVRVNSNDLIITTAEQLKAFAQEISSGLNDYDGRVVRLGADIDMTGIGMIPIGTAEHPFMGEFNGQGHTITGLTINASTQDNVGLFGFLMNAYIHNVHIVGANVVGQNHVGVLFGHTMYSPCYISDVYVENSSVTGLGSVGGIGGRVADPNNIAYATIERCYFTGSVTTAYENPNDAAWAGGICGNVLRGVISDCGCIATITRSTSGELKAGLIGGTNGSVTVRRCYATDLNNTRLALVNGRGNGASVSENSCPATIATHDGMKSVLGNNWFYFTVTAQLPIPASLGRYFSDNPLVEIGDFVFCPNDLSTTNYNDYYVLEYCGNGGSVTIPSQITVRDMTTGNYVSKPVTRIGDSVFWRRNDVTSVTITQGIQSIGIKSFAETGITSISMPNSIKQVRDYAFDSCLSLTSIYIAEGAFANSSTDYIGSLAFLYCPNIASINVAANNQAYMAIGDILFTKDGSEIILCAPKGATRGYYSAPNDVRSINYGAFSYCTQLTGITFPAGLWTTESEFLFGCDNLRYVDLSQCTNWAEGFWGIGAGATVHRDPIGIVDYTFAGLPEHAIIYMPADRDHDANGERNVVIGNVGTELYLTDGIDFDPKVTFTPSGASYDGVFSAKMSTYSKPLFDENGNPVYEKDDDGNTVYEDVYDESGHLLYEEDGVTPQRQPVQVYANEQEPQGYTICLPFNATMLASSKAKLYTPTKTEVIDGVTTVVFSEVVSRTMNAYQPYYILVSSGNVTFKGTPVEVAQHQVAGTTDLNGSIFQFKGSTVSIANESLYNESNPTYILGNDAKWHRVTSGDVDACVNPFRAYFQATATTDVSTIAMRFDDQVEVSSGGWQAIASPMHDANQTYESIKNIACITNANYDLFRYNESIATWENQKASEGIATGFNTLDAGRGYIYRNSDATTISFYGERNSGTITGPALTVDGPVTMRGFNLVGNPYPHPICKSQAFNVASGVLADGWYSLEPNGTWRARLDSDPIAIGQAALVKANQAVGNLQFSDITPSTSKSSPSEPFTLAFTVRDSKYSDVTFVHLGNGSGLPKVAHLNAEAPMLSIPVDGTDYAIAMLAKGTTEFPMGFSGNLGEYTIGLADNAVINGFVECRLLDNVTGLDIDLLQHSYTFSATGNDASRFTIKLVYADSQMSSDNAPFAYQRGDQVVITETGVLHVFDIMGRELFSTEVLSIPFSLNRTQFPSTGIYILRLGEKCQKIVIR